MLQSTEFRPLDSLLPATAGAVSPELEGNLPAGRDFARLLRERAPADAAAGLTALLPTGDALPEGGKELPVLAGSGAPRVPELLPEGDELTGLPTEFADFADLPDFADGQALPPAEILPAATVALPRDGEAPAAAGQELAALQRMLPPMTSTTPVQRAVSAAVGAEAVAGSPMRDTRMASRAVQAQGFAKSLLQTASEPATARGGLSLTDSAIAPAAELRPIGTDSGHGLRQMLAPTPIPVEVPVGPLPAGDRVAAETMMAVGDLRLEGLEPLQRPLPMPAAPLTALSTPASPASPLPIDVPVANARWGEALGERVLWMTGQKLGTAEIRLNPAELGPVRIEIKLDDNQAQVHFTAQHAATREAIEQALPRLRELFSSEGLTLASTDVSEDGVRQQQNGRDERGGRSLAGTGQDGQDAGDEAEPVTVSQRLADGLIDTFA
jgi:Flagellar hook-length control protein FliK